MNTLEDLLARREDVELEVKKASGRDGKGELPQSFWETYSAFANTNGGIVLLGAEEDADGNITPIGIKDIAKIRKALWNGLNNPQQISQNLLRDGDVQIVDSGDKQLLWITVPRADRKQRPIYVGSNPLTGTYRRGFDGDYRCDMNAVRRMIAESEEEIRDAKILEHFGLDDIDAESLAAYRNEFRATKPGHPWISLDDKELLRQLGGWGQDRTTGIEGLTAAGLLMFGKLRPILDAIPNYLLDYQERPADATEQRWIDRITTDGSWSGNLFDFYRRVFPRLVNDLKVPFRLEQGVKRIDESNVHEALREALVNALIHADYSGQIGTLIIKYTVGFVFRNPGTLRLPLYVVWSGGSSDCRNRNLQKMFQLIGASEQAGSGIPKILRAWREQDWRMPLVAEDVRTEVTLLRLPMMSFLPPDKIAELDELFGEHFRTLDTTQRLAVATAHIEGQVTNERLREISGEHPSDLTLLLHGLVDQGFLTRVGVGRGTHYHIPGKAPGFIQGPTLFDLAKVDLDSSEHLETGSEHLRPSSEHLRPSSEHLNSNNSVVVQVRESKKAESQIVENAILLLCSDQFQPLSELALELNRTSNTLRIHYINDMVKKGRLILRYPDKPNHPDQAYKSVASAPD